MLTTAPSESHVSLNVYRMHRYVLQCCMSQAGIAESQKAGKARSIGFRSPLTTVSAQHVIDSSAGRVRVPTASDCVTIA